MGHCTAKAVTKRHASDQGGIGTAAHSAQTKNRERERESARLHAQGAHRLREKFVEPGSPGARTKRGGETQWRRAAGFFFCGDVGKDGISSIRVSGEWAGGGTR